MILLELATVGLLLLTGIYLSAFFSGSETAFYRLSLLRLSVEADAGDRACRRILWFVRHPAQFVATTLIGNNVANYVVTLATGFALAVLVTRPSDAAEILLTLAVSPVVFLFGELVPKNTNYLMPLRSLRRRITFFRGCYYAFLPLSWPLVALTHWFERMTGTSDADVQSLLGRPQIDDLVSHGHVGGVLTDSQAAMTSRLLAVGAESVRDSVRSSDFEFGLPEDVSRGDLLKHASAYGLTDIPMYQKRDGGRREWVSGVAIGTILKSDAAPASVAGPLPRVSSGATKLTAVRRIRESRSGYAIVTEKGEVIGLVSLHSMLQTLFRDPPRLPV